MNSIKTMLLRHWQNVIQGFDTVDHVLRRRDMLERLESDTNISSDSKSDRPAGYVPLRRVAAMVAICGPVYGAAMGSYAFISGDRVLWEQLPQILYSGLKVPLLLAITVAISLPSFFVINSRANRMI